MKKLAVIGYGGMGGWHTRAAQNSDAVELAGVYDIKKERNEAAEAAGIRAYKSLKELLSDQSVDLVTIAVPNDDHEKLAIAAMRAGKHVICEKPVTLSVRSLERMIAVSKETGKLLTVHQNRRFDVDYLAMQQIVDSGKIGGILDIESRIHGSRGIPSDWRGLKKYGGGMLYDWGIHLLDQVLLVMGSRKIVKLFCDFDHITNKEVDDGFRLTLWFDDGARGYIEVGTYNFIAMPRFYLRCEKGSALIRDWRENAQVVRCKAWHESDVLPVQTAAGLTKTMAPRDGITTDTFEWTRPTADVHDFYRNFCAAIDGKEEQLVTHAQMLRDLKVIEEAFRSAKTGKTIALSEPL